MFNMELTYLTNIFWNQLLLKNSVTQHLRAILVEASKEGEHTLVQLSTRTCGMASCKVRSSDLHNFKELLIGPLNQATGKSRKHLIIYS